MRRVLTALIIAAFIVCALGAVAKPVQLKYKFKPGQVDAYKMVMDMKMSMPGPSGTPSEPMNMKMTAQWTQKVMKVFRDGSARVKSTYDHISMSMPTGRTPKSATITMIMMPDGSVKQMSGQNAFAGAMEGIDLSSMMNKMGLFGNPRLPKKSVNVGQLWVNEQPMLGAGQLKSVSHLDAAAVAVGNYTASKIRQSVSGQLDVQKMMSAMAGPGDPAQSNGMKGTMVLNGSTITYFLRDKGKMLRTDGVMSAVTKMNMPSQTRPKGSPSQMIMNMDMKMSITKIK